MTGTKRLALFVTGGHLQKEFVRPFGNNYMEKIVITNLNEKSGNQQMGDGWTQYYINHMHSKLIFLITERNFRFVVLTGNLNSKHWNDHVSNASHTL